LCGSPCKVTCQTKARNQTICAIYMCVCLISMAGDDVSNSALHARPVLACTKQERVCSFLECVYSTYNHSPEEPQSPAFQVREEITG
jgi:hypothetical protein